MKRKVADACLWIVVGVAIMLAGSLASDFYAGGWWWGSATGAERGATVAIIGAGAVTAVVQILGWVSAAKTNKKSEEE